MSSTDAAAVDLRLRKFRVRPDPQPHLRRQRTRELSDIDPRFASQVRKERMMYLWENARRREGRINSALGSRITRSVSWVCVQYGSN